MITLELALGELALATNRRASYARVFISVLDPTARFNKTLMKDTHLNISVSIIRAIRSSCALVSCPIYAPDSWRMIRC